MDVCSPEEIKQLMNTIQGPYLLTLKSTYIDYKSNVRYSGRL